MAGSGPAEGSRGAGAKVVSRLPPAISSVAASRMAGSTEEGAVLFRQSPPAQEGAPAFAPSKPGWNSSLARHPLIDPVRPYFRIQAGTRFPGFHRAGPRRSVWVERGGSNWERPESRSAHRSGRGQSSWQGFERILSRRNRRLPGSFPASIPNWRPWRSFGCWRTEYGSPHPFRQAPPRAWPRWSLFLPTIRGPRRFRFLHEEHDFHD